jgi:hypothetical protein
MKKSPLPVNRIRGQPFEMLNGDEQREESAPCAEPEIGA